MSSRPDIGRPPVASYSAFTVGLRYSSESETSERNGSSSWFNAGTAECAKIVVRAGSRPMAR